MTSTIQAPRARALAVALTLSTIVAAPACGQDAVRITPATGREYGLVELTSAIEAFVAAGRTPAAFATLVDRARALRATMDEAVAAEIERRLLVLALEPAAATMEVQDAEVASSLWAFGLARPFTAKAPDGTPDVRPEPLAALPGERDAAYLLRVCEGPLAVECRNAVPEAHAGLVRMVATRRIVERIRNAVAGCYPCRGEPAWDDAVTRWEALDRRSVELGSKLLKTYAPSRWPEAGAGATDRAVDATGRVTASGDLFIDEVRVELTPAEPGRGGARAAVRGLDPAWGPLVGKTLGLHIDPTEPWGLVALIDREARAAGVDVVIDARVPSYPWALRRYPAYPPPPGASAELPVQVVLRAADTAAAARASRDDGDGDDAERRAP